MPLYYWRVVHPLVAKGRPGGQFLRSQRHVADPSVAPLSPQGGDGQAARRSGMRWLLLENLAQAEAFPVRSTSCRFIRTGGCFRGKQGRAGVRIASVARKKRAVIATGSPTAAPHPADWVTRYPHIGIIARIAA